MGEVVVRIPGEPFAQPRARAAVIAGRAVIYDPKKARNWKATAQHHMVLAAVAADRAECLAGPVDLQVLAVFTCPKSDHRKREPLARRWHAKKPDADNVLKAVKDAAKGVLWLDDAQVCRETCEKHIGAQGEAPYVEVRVRALPPLLRGGDATCCVEAAPTTPCPTMSDEAPAATGALPLERRENVRTVNEAGLLERASLFGPMGEEAP